MREEWQAPLRLPDLGALRHLGSPDGARTTARDIAAREGTIGVDLGRARRRWSTRASSRSRPAATGTLAFAADYPGFFLGYLGDEATDARDLARRLVSSPATSPRIDADGYVFILGRADDCFKSKGVLIVAARARRRDPRARRVRRGLRVSDPRQRDRQSNRRRRGAALGAAAGIADRAGRSPPRSPAASRRSSCRSVFWCSIAMPKNANGKTQRSAVVRMALVQLGMMQAG